MEQKLQSILRSDLLEKYLMGTTSDVETLQAESHIAKYPEVRKHYEAMQDNLETYARMNDVVPPEGLKEVVIKRIQNEKGRYYQVSKISFCRQFCPFVYNRRFIFLLESESNATK